MTLNDKARIYFKWSCIALLGSDPVAADKLLSQNLDIIKEIAGELLKKIKYEPIEIYRGVILTEEILELKSHPNFTYISFSEDKKIAESFADNSPKGFGSLFYLGDYGYVVRHTPKPEEILFHYRFMELLPYKRVFIEAGLGDETLNEQKEVMLLQPQESFTKIKKYETTRNKATI
jgi:hypothetical protein